jgi:hypothetical protein
MAKISKCPQCGHKVTIPAAVEEDQLVRCPLCDGEFLLAETMPDAEEAPPELLAAGAVPDVAREAEADSEPETEAAADEQAQATEDGRDEPAKTAPSIKLWDDVSEAPKIDTEESAEEDGEEPHAAGFRFAGIVTRDEGDEADGEAAGAGGGRKRNKEKSALREILGIVLGGMGGVLLAYYGLNLFGGPRFDFADVYLPGIQHTVKHRPTWWPGWLCFEGEPADDELDIEAELSKLDLPDPGTSSPGPARGGNNSGDSNRQAGGNPAAAVRAPKPVAVPAGFVSLASPPSFQPGELGEALKAAHNAFGCPRCNSTGKVVEGGAEHDCPDCQGHPPDGMTPAAYTRFCRLAEVAAFVETAPGGQLAARKSATADLLDAVGKKPENVIEIGRLAASVLDREDRQTSGILLSGTVKATGQEGEIQTATVKLAGIERTVTLAARRSLGLAAGDRVLVLGSLVAESPQPPVGHDPAEPLVWLGLCEKFEQ